MKSTDWIPVMTAAKLTGMWYQTLYNAIRAGKLPCRLESIPQARVRVKDVRALKAKLAPTYMLNRLKTQCPRGHAYTEANTYVYKNRRDCRICIRVRQRGRYVPRRIYASGSIINRASEKVVRHRTTLEEGDTRHGPGH
jgi:hypothetical protein